MNTTHDDTTTTHELERCSTCGRYGWHSTERCPTNHAHRMPKFVNPFPNLPVPAGATADDWSVLTNYPEDLVRFLTWSRHDTDKVGVAVDGSQLADGTVERAVSIYDAQDKELTAVDARALAAALIEAADALDRL